MRNQKQNILVRTHLEIMPQDDLQKHGDWEYECVRQ